MPVVPRRILVSRLSAMGDVAMVVPVLLALNKSYPSIEVFLLTQKRFFALFRDLEQVNLIEADLKGRHKGLPGLVRLSREINALEIETFLDLHNVLRTKVVRGLTKKARIFTIDKGRSEKKRLVKDPNFFQPLAHTTERYLQVFHKAGFQFQLEKNAFLSRRDLSQKIKEVLGEKSTKWIGFAPFAAHKTKALTVKRARKITQRIASEFDVKIILIGGGKQEERKLDLVAATTSQVFNMAGKFTFEEELDVISNLDAMIAMDSGNGHLAALFNVPTITLWGNTHPYAGFAPYAQPDENQICADREKFPLLPTSVFGNEKVKGYLKVTNSIKISRVVKRLREVL
ncbi:heptosyltransferase [Nonlabens spongiae]|uniref:Heptosyltransferase n=1 Tax=Nonlabens spongiae TaxID=331648 RepID=A0A1W6ML99_9FLAO|nr:glycosyltransferase family 9 protein [Nonlabens spongiae]ARN78373.1 heptosyltransferase [Nonlabens spongiae]